MVRIPGFHVAEKLGEGPQSVVYRGFERTAPDRPLALKVFKTTSLSEGQHARFRQKVEHLKLLRDPLLISPLAFEVKGGVRFLVQEYFDGLPVDEWACRQVSVSLGDFFRIACQLAAALDRVHEAGIVHGGVKPHNILVQPATLDIRLTGFVTPLDARDVSHFIYDPSYVRGTLAYTSPEQTGRIHHVVGFSSDLYSLGIVFYELLTGKLPFTSTDPLALIHQHLAEEAAPVRVVKPDVPVTLGTIVARLTLKQPEKRYQSARGLLADLVRCRTEWEVGRSIGRFPLATQDRSRRLVFISKMVGRDREAQAVLDAFEPVTRGEFRSVFISGMPGIGKTRLIQELQQPIIRHRGYFTSGKFDIYQRNIPYSSIIEALRNLIRTFLTEGQERVLAWRRRILDAVGKNGRVLTDVIPELERLIGPQPAVQPLPPVESRNRFHNLFDRFLGCLASKDSPLTLFIDDLQWCDVASFDFLATVFANAEEHPGLMLLGAYRHNEVDSSHPLAKLIAKVKNAGGYLDEIRVQPLDARCCHEMVSYVLDAPLSHTEALADFLVDLTEGNPLFVSESLSYLYNEDLLCVDEDLQWRWELDRIRGSNMPSSVVALFSSKISKLPPETVDMLETCACMGNTVKPEDLAKVRDLALGEVFERLKPCLGQGLMIENRGQFQFVHDRVQEAVLSAIAPERRRTIHWDIGQRLLEAALRETGWEAVDNLFAIASHLNLGRPDVLSPEQNRRLAEVNFQAGEKALNSLATEAANEFFATSRGFLPADSWEKDYEQTFRIFKKAARTELMCGHPDRSDALLDQLLQHARTDLDKAECLADQTTSLSSIGNFAKAIETGNLGLALFGKAIPEDPEEADRKRSELTAEIRSKGDIWQTILGMPCSSDRKSKIELAFYSELVPDLYLAGRVGQLYLTAAQATAHCLSGSMDDSVIYAFCALGLMHAEREEFELSFKYEDLVRGLSARFPNTFGASRGLNGNAWVLTHTRGTAEELADICLQAQQSGKNCGDLYTAGISYAPLMWTLQIQGADFGGIETYAEECRRFSARYNLPFSDGLAEAMQVGWLAPMKKGYEPVPMEERVAKWERDNHLAAAGSYFLHLALSHYYFGEHEEAAQALAATKRYFSALSESLIKREWHVFQALNELRLHERRLGHPEGGASAVDHDPVLGEIAPLVAKIENWAELGPLWRPYLAFLRAERARVTGQRERARTLFLNAIESAHEAGYTFLEGHLNECLGELQVARGRGSARPFFLEAARLYRRCRAERKELRLIELHPEFFEEETFVPVPAEAPEQAPYALPDLDVGYLMRSALAISAEIEQEALFQRIMRTVIESSGAQHGYLLLADGDQLRVRAESHAGDVEPVRTGEHRLEDCSGICKAIVRYVFRTGERLVLADAINDGDFKDNTEVRALSLRSVFCLPIVKQARTIGVLYLENRLAPHMFTPTGTQTTELLTAQAAISLENARLLEEMKRADETLTRERENLAVTLHSIGDAVIATDTGSRVVMLNRVAEELTGWPQSEAFGRALADVFCIVNEGTGVPAEDPVRKVLESGHIIGLANHTALVSRDGKRISIADSAAPIRGAGGRILGVVLVFRDVTESRLAEEALRQRELELSELNRTLEQRVRDRTAELDKANRTLRMVSECNQALVRITEEEELVKRISRLVVEMGGYRMAWVGYVQFDSAGALSVHPVASHGAEEGLLRLCPGTWTDGADGCSPTGDCVRSARPRVVPALSDCPAACASRAEALRKGFGSLVALPLTAGGSSFGALTIFSEKRDAFDAPQVMLLEELAADLAFGITALRAKAERDHAYRIADNRANQLRALASELVQTEQRERQRLAKILHDHLQQLLVAAKFSIGSLARNDAVREACQQVTDVLDQAIQASRSLTAELSPPVLQEKGLAAGLEWLARDMCEKHGLKVSVQADSTAAPLDPPLRIFLFETVRELLFNIVKHAQVDAACVRCERTDTQVIIRVEDGGAGFDPAMLDDGKGFGLLSIRERTSYLGGHLTVESTPGWGSRFTLVVPLALANATHVPLDESAFVEGQAAKHISSAPAAGTEDRKIRVLLVDDHPVMRQGLGRLLEDYPDILVAGEASNGKAGVELARDLRPDVVVMDISMPVMDGIAATQVICRELPEIAVIGLSMHEDPIMESAIRAAGAVAFVTKGGPSDCLVAAIHAAVRRG
ncbi:MAG: AAA family ATPase [Acidobacteriota bacterium]